jgi:hypothetical protein
MSYKPTYNFRRGFVEAHLDDEIKRIYESISTVESKIPVVPTSTDRLVYKKTAGSLGASVTKFAVPDTLKKGYYRVAILLEDDAGVASADTVLASVFHYNDTPAEVTTVTSTLTLGDLSTDRIMETILVYHRGVSPISFSTTYTAVGGSDTYRYAFTVERLF